MDWYIRIGYFIKDICLRSNISDILICWAYFLCKVTYNTQTNVASRAGSRNIQLLLLLKLTILASFTK